mmetsp:Transcript_17021/g.31916  ORF Transcript_17021/g.31916 Transcript_17021/m.31916 type:complete len:487 (-) Transcript_17021:124-1584(-)
MEVMAQPQSPLPGAKGQLQKQPSADAWPPLISRSNSPQASRQNVRLPSNVGAPSATGSIQDRSPQQKQRSRRGSSSSATPQREAARWRDMYRDLDQEKIQVEEDLQRKREQQSAIAAEVQALRAELEKEKAETEQATRQFEEKIERERREATRAQMKLMKAQLNGNAQDSEAAGVKAEVTAKTREILEAMREIREQQQQAFKQVKSLSYAMLKTCSQPTPGASASTAGVSSPIGSDVGRGLVVVGMPRSPPRSPPSSEAGSHLRRSPGRGLTSSRSGSLAGGRHRSPSLPKVLEGGVLRPRASSRSPSPSVVGSAQGGGLLMPRASSRSPSPSVIGDDGQRRWFQAMKANLEQFGAVEVFADEGSQECMCCNQLISTPYRVRPRKCSHVFHVECLLHWWSEGTCPVCHASFAPEEGPPGLQLTSRSSSTTTALRQIPRKRGSSPSVASTAAVSRRQGSSEVGSRMASFSPEQQASHYSPKALSPAL